MLYNSQRIKFTSLVTQIGRGFLEKTGIDNGTGEAEWFCEGWGEELQLCSEGLNFNFY